MKFRLFAICCASILAECLSLTIAEEPIAIGSRRELLVDDYLIERTEGQIALRLHSPERREIVLVFNQPWEGSKSGAYTTVFQDGEHYRAYYITQQTPIGVSPPYPVLTCYAESQDGIHWVKPELGQFEFAGSKKNNIIMWEGYEDSEAIIVPFKDPNPNCKPEECYKALVNIHSSLRALKSADGLHWEQISDQPVIIQGTFDSQNLAFWDPIRNEYRAYMRDFRDGLRDIRTATSQDFIHWTATEWLNYSGAPPQQQLYTNQIIPYYRAPHIFLGFPARYIERGWCDSMRALPELKHRKQRSALEDRFGMALTDGLFMSSRDGLTFHRWSEAFIRPGLRGTDNWAYGDNYQSWGLVTTKSAIPDAPEELSLYATEGYWLGTANKLRRFTIRKDGFVSMCASFAGGEFTTKPITFQGTRLELNFSTSAAGGIRVEIQAADGKPIEGFALGDSSEVFGDDLERIVTWKHGSEVNKLAGQPIRLRFTLSDADLYAFQFVDR